MRKKHKSWEEYYNRRRRDVRIKVNDLVLIQTHFLSAAGRKQVGKFMPKFEGPYRVLDVQGPSRLPDCRLNKSTPVESRTEGSGRDNKTRQTRATMRGCNKQAERPVRSNQATTRRTCPYYLRSRVKESDGIPEEQRNIEINGIPHSRIRRRSLSMEALDGDPGDGGAPLMRLYEGRYYLAGVASWNSTQGCRNKGEPRQDKSSGAQKPSGKQFGEGSNIGALQDSRVQFSALGQQQFTVSRGCRKSDTDDVIYQQLFVSHRNKHSKYMPVYTDGSKTEGHIGCGVVINDSTILSFTYIVLCLL
ncbi:uncharacterized protein TNCV_4557461 [Trichonephila clavipes]|nr:uncharacterized protein TNCV_4557461 [Trichonephila clavipes]